MANENIFRGYAARAAGGRLEPFEFDAGPLGDEQVEIAVSHCGICHSDLSVLRNEWGNAVYPLVPGHEVAGTVVKVGPKARRARVGQKVGLGWFSESCMSCPQCLSGNHNLCGSNEQTMIGRHGGYADRVRCHWAWATPLPEGLDAASAGPLFCGGITVFNPIVQSGLRPASRAGVVGIGGLGHMALKFLNKWGCEVVAFTSSESKRDEAMRLGAHRVVASGDDAAIAKLAGSFDLILVTVNVALNWGAYIDALAPKGRLHFVGAVLEPLGVGVFPLLIGQRSISGSPLGSPATAGAMVEFCARHGIAPQVERFPMSKANEALAHLDSGRARYRIVLDADF